MIRPDKTESARAFFSDRERVETALHRGVRTALWRHKQLGQPIVVWRDGKVVWIPAAEIEVEGQ